MQMFSYSTASPEYSTVSLCFTALFTISHNAQVRLVSKIRRGPSHNPVVFNEQHLSRADIHTDDTEAVHSCPERESGLQRRGKGFLRRRPKEGLLQC